MKSKENKINYSTIYSRINNKETIMTHSFCLLGLAINYKETSMLYMLKATRIPYAHKKWKDTLIPAMDEWS